MSRDNAGGAPSARSRHALVEDVAGVSIVVIVNVMKDEKIGLSALRRSLPWLRAALVDFKDFEDDDGKQVVRLDWFRNERDSMAGETNDMRHVQDETSQGLRTLDSAWLPMNQRYARSPVLSIVLMPDLKYPDAQPADLCRVSSSIFVSTTLDSCKISCVLLDVREAAAFFQLILSHLSRHAVLTHFQAVSFATDLLDI